MHDERRMLSEGGGRKRGQQRERGERHNSTVGSSNLGQRRRLGSGKGGAMGSGSGAGSTTAGNGTNGVGGRGDSDLSSRPIFYLKLHKATDPYLLLT